MRQQQKNRPNNAGFTIVELTIATGVFAIILLLALVGFMQIGKLFYKGVNLTRTSDVSKQVINSIRNDVSFDTFNGSYNPQNSPLASPSLDRWYFCAGSNRYTYILRKELDIAAQNNEISSTPVPLWNKFAMLKDRVTSGCPDPFDPDGGALIDPANVTELLGDRMRISDLAIAQLLPTNDKLYTIRIKITYGDDEVLQNPSTTNPNCIANNTTGSSFCFVSELRTIVRKGL